MSHFNYLSGKETELITFLCEGCGLRFPMRKLFYPSDRKFLLEGSALGKDRKSLANYVCSRKCSNMASKKKRERGESYLLYLEIQQQIQKEIDLIEMMELDKPIEKIIIPCPYCHGRNVQKRGMNKTHRYYDFHHVSHFRKAYYCKDCKVYFSGEKEYFV